MKKLIFLLILAQFLIVWAEAVPSDNLKIAKKEQVMEKNMIGDGFIVRIAEIEVHPQYLQEYLAYAEEVDRLSIEREPGVICLFPMQHADNPNKISILEIYASEELYKQHLNTAHFQKYKKGTLHMVKSLKLPEMRPLDKKTMKQIFKKLK